MRLVTPAQFVQFLNRDHQTTPPAAFGSLPWVSRSLAPDGSPAAPPLHSIGRCSLHDNPPPPLQVDGGMPDWLFGPALGDGRPPPAALFSGGLPRRSFERPCGLSGRELDLLHDSPLPF